jgi:GntR family transcriptional regulator
MPDLSLLFKIDHSSKLPLYELIEQNFHDLILRDQLKTGDPIPPEYDLVEYYGVSRMTLRRALENLARQGWIVRQQGIGTFARKPITTRIAPSRLSFTEQMRFIGRQPSSRLISLKVVKATQEVATSLNIREGELAVEISRVRLADHEPILLEITYLSQERFPGLENATNLETGSLYETLRTEYGMNVVNMHQTLEPVLLDSQDAALLEAEAGTPAIMSEVISFSADGQPIEYTWSITSGSKCKFYFRFHRGENAP